MSSNQAVYWYMILDVTTEATKLLYVTDNRRAIHRGYILKAEGLKVIAPPLEARSLSKLDKLQLQYLHYQLIPNVAPPEDYSQLVQECFEAIKKFPTDTTSLDDLVKEVAKLWTALSLTNPNVVAPNEVGDVVKTAERPRAKGVTGMVWEIADRLYKDGGNTMPDRKLVMDECAKAEINSATAATQFAKWKKSITGI
jgi:hypothetical protein